MFYKAYTEKTSKMCLNFTANSFVFRRIHREISHITFSINFASGEVPKCVWTSRQTALLLDAKIVNMRPESFLQNLQAKNFQNEPERQGKELRFWTHKSWNCAMNCYCELCRQRTSKIRLKFAANSFVFGRKSRDNAPRTFLQPTQGENFRTSSELPRKQLHFWTHKSWKCANNIFCKSCRQKISKMRLTFTANSFVFGRINRENASKNFFVNLEWGELPKCVWT